MVTQWGGISPKTVNCGWIAWLVSQLTNLLIFLMPTLSSITSILLSNLVCVYAEIPQLSFYVSAAMATLSHSFSLVFKFYVLV